MERLFQKFKQNFFYILLALLVFIPLYPKFPLFSVNGTYVAVRLEDFLIALAILFWGLINLGNFRIYLKQRIFQVFILFWLIGGLSVLSGLLIAHSVSPGLGLLHWLRRIEEMSLFLVAAASVRSISQVKLVTKVLLVLTLIIVLYGFGQQWLQFPIISTTNKEYSKGLILYLTGAARVNSTFAGHYDLAAYLSIVIVLFSSIFFYYTKLKEKLAVSLISLLSFILLGLTAARVSFAAALAGLAVSFFLNGKKLLIIGLILLSSITVAVVPELRHRLVATITVNLLQGGGPKYEIPADVTNQTPLLQGKIPYASRDAYLAQALHESTISASQAAKIPRDIAPGEPLNTTELGVFRSFGIRLNAEWPRAIRAFKKNPLLGEGYSSLTIATDNDFLRSLGETGLLGTLAFILVFWLIIKRFIEFTKSSPRGFERYFTIGILCGILAVLVNSTFIDILEASKIGEIFWLLLGVTWALVEGFNV